MRESEESKVKPDVGMVKEGASGRFDEILTERSDSISG